VGHPRPHVHGHVEHLGRYGLIVDGVVAKPIPPVAAIEGPGLLLGHGYDVGHVHVAVPVEVALLAVAGQRPEAHPVLGLASTIGWVVGEQPFPLQDYRDCRVEVSHDSPGY
jgi:hypothetical protein